MNKKNRNLQAESLLVREQDNLYKDNDGLPDSLLSLQAEQETGRPGC